MCAIDALAIPRMVLQASRITARCVVCRCHLACVVAANGGVENENQNSEAARVVWEPGVIGRQACNSLCTDLILLAGVAPHRATPSPFPCRKRLPWAMPFSPFRENFLIAFLDEATCERPLVPT